MRNIVVLLVAFLSMTSSANEVFSVDPTEYVITGRDRYDNEAYTINIVLDRDAKHTTIKSLAVKIYDQALDLPNEILDLITNPNLAQVRALNDAGVFGSYFTIYIPFGEVGRCRVARRYTKHKALHISTLGSISENQINVRIYDPCE